MRRWVLLLLLMTLIPLSFSLAQETTRYDNPDMGIAFDMPSDWEVQTTIDTLIAGTPEALETVGQGLTPSTLIVLILVGTFASLHVPNAAALPEQLIKLIPPG